MTRLDIVGSFSRHAGPRRLCERYPSSHCEVTTPPDAGYCDAGGCPLGIDKVGASDGDLVRRVLAGDTGAYAALVARYRDRLGRYAVHMLGDRQDAEEALQDAFVRAYRSLARCDDPERFGAWLYGILVNRCRTTGGRAARPEPPGAGSPGRATSRSRRSAGWRSQRGSPPSRWCYRAGAPGQRRPRRACHASLSSSSSPPARQACRSWATSTTGTPPAPRCDLHNAAARCGPRSFRSLQGATVTPSSWTAPAGSPIPRLHARAMTSSGHRARS